MIAPALLELVRSRCAFARRRGIDAFHLSAALDIVAPVAGRTWTAICCWCLDRTAHTTADELVHRVALERWQNGGPCMLCPYVGCDTLVAALENQALAR